MQRTCMHGAFVRVRYWVDEAGGLQHLWSRERLYIKKTHKYMYTFMR